MRIFVLETARIRDFVADHVEQVLRFKPDSVLALTTGNTPLDTGIYDEWIRRAKAGRIRFDEATLINPDEQIGIDRQHPESYYAYMRKHLLQAIHFDEKRWIIPDGAAADPEAECRRVEEAVQSRGVDWQLVGIGRNGHVCFIEPAEALPAACYVTPIAQSNRELYAPLFDGVDNVPTHAITYGWGTLMRSQALWLVAAGAQKASIVAQALTLPVTTRLPASILQIHPGAVIVLDHEAAAQLPSHLRTEFI